MTLLLLAMTVLGASPLFMVHELNRNGMSTTESSFIVISFGPGACSFIFYFYLRQAKTGLNTFCSEFQRLQDTLTISEAKLKRLFTSLCIYRLIGCIFAVLSGISFQFGWMPTKPDHMEVAVWETIVWCCFVINLFTILNPLEIVVEILIQQCFRALNLAFEEYKRTWKFTKNKTIVLDEASKLVKLLHVLNDFSGSLLFFGFFISLFTLLFNTFYGFLTLTAFRMDEPLVFFVGLGNAGWGLYNMSKIGAYIRFGWQLSKQMRWLKKNIQLYQIENSSSLSDKDNHVISFLVDSCAKGSAIQPLEIFDLSISTGIGISAWLITNLIVLLQFRGGEGQKLMYNDTIIIALNDTNT